MGSRVPLLIVLAFAVVGSAQAGPDALPEFGDLRELPYWAFQQHHVRPYQARNGERVDMINLRGSIVQELKYDASATGALIADADGGKERRAIFEQAAADIMASGRTLGTPQQVGDFLWERSVELAYIRRFLPDFHPTDASGPVDVRFHGFEAAWAIEALENKIGLLSLSTREADKRAAEMLLEAHRVLVKPMTRVPTSAHAFQRFLTKRFDVPDYLAREVVTMSYVKAPGFRRKPNAKGKRAGK